MNAPSLPRVLPWAHDFLADPFRKYLCLALVLIGMVVGWFGQDTDSILTEPAGRTVQFFFHPNCPHCRQQKIFNQYLKAKYPEVAFVEHDTSHPEQARMLADLLQKRAPARKKATVPLTVIGPYLVAGFDSAATTGVTLEKAIQAYVRDDPTLFTATDQVWQEQESVTLPLLGEIRPADYSLPLLAMTIGLVDGFNPCAMWVLVYLISLIATLHDLAHIDRLQVLTDHPTVVVRQKQQFVHIGWVRFGRAHSDLLKAGVHKHIDLFRNTCLCHCVLQELQDIIQDDISFFFICLDQRLE